MIGLVFVTVLFAPPALRADPGPTAAYGKCVEKHIARAEKKTDLKDSRSETLQRCGGEAQEKAEWYRRNKVALVEAMGAAHVKPAGPHMDYFLIKAYQEGHTGGSLDSTGR
ncbi:MAG: hypothetical protein WHS86_12310 [Desulfosoma sp.]